MKSIVKRIRFLILLILSMLILALSSCYDLGSYGEEGNEEEYYEAFGDVKGIYPHGIKEYDIEDSLYNPYTVENLDWEDEDDAVETHPYLYIVIPIEKDLTIDSLALYMKSPSDVFAKLSVFYFSTESLLPEKISFFDSPDTEKVKETDEHGNEVEVEKEIEYDDPKISDALANVGVSLKENEWNSFLIEEFNQTGYNDGCIHAVEDSYIYIRVENNYGKNKKTMTSFEFTMIDLLIRAI